MADQQQICGVLDPTISNSLKVWVKQGNNQVCGIIGPGTSRTLSAKWDSPLEQTNAGSNTDSRLGGGLQAASGGTMITTFSTTQIWQGNMPLKFQLNIIFIAQTNAVSEVMLPLQRLEEFASGEVKGMLPIDGKAVMEQVKAFVGSLSSNEAAFGKIPTPVTINIGRKMIIPMCVIENISIPLDKEATRDGDLIRAEVQLDVQTLVMKNRSDIAASWAGS